MSKIIDRFLSFNEEQRNFIKELVKDYCYDDIYFYNTNDSTQYLYRISEKLFKNEIKFHLEFELDIDSLYGNNYNIVYEREIEIIKLNSQFNCNETIKEKIINFRNLQEIKKYIEITEAQKEIEEIMNLKNKTSKKRSRL